MLESLDEMAAKLFVYSLVLEYDHRLTVQEYEDLNLEIEMLLAFLKVFKGSLNVQYH